MARSFFAAVVCNEKPSFFASCQYFHRPILAKNNPKDLHAAIIHVDPGFSAISVLGLPFLCNISLTSPVIPSGCKASRKEFFC